MHVLVAGGAGFAGSTYVRSRIAAGDRVTVLDALTYASNLANLAGVAAAPAYRFVRGDIRDAAVLDAVLPGADAVVNFAAETHVDRSIAAAAPFVATNVVGAQVLFDACVRHAIGRVVQVGTDEVYGPRERGAAVESDALRPSSPYSAAKAGGDLLALAYAQTHGLDVRITRSSNNYGPYQYPEKLVPRFVTRLLCGRTVPLYGDGRQVRDWLHVDDHVRGVQLVLERGARGEIYNIGGGRSLENREITAILLDALGCGWDRVEQVPDRPGHDRRYAIDDAKARALGHAPAVRFEDGIAETVEWYRAHRDWWEPLLARSVLP